MAVIIWIRHRGNLREIARIAARCNGLISKEAIAIWADDLFAEHAFTAEDYREAGRRMPERIAEGGRAALLGRPQITDVVSLAKEARSRRLEAQAAAASTKRIEARLDRDEDDQRVGLWLCREAMAGRTPSPEAVAQYRAALPKREEEAR
jgi:hypothetical protein